MTTSNSRPFAPWIVMMRTREEIGLSSDLVTPIGYLDLYLTFSGFRILPLVARVEPDYQLKINPGEVADVFEVPLEFLMSPANHQRLKRDWNGMLALGGNIYFLAKIFSADGKSFQYTAAQMTGMSQEAYAQMMLQGGRSPEGNRYKSEQK